MRQENLPTELLRSFVTVSDLGGYTKAGEVLHRTQPAISLQMRRLEQIVGAKLLVHDGKRMHLTEAGEQLSIYARQILHLNDDAISHFHPKSIHGAIRVGLPSDYAVSFLQETVFKFGRDNPNVELEICCDLSRNLLEQLHADQLSLVVGHISENYRQYLVHSWEDQPIWVAGTNFQMSKRKPLPLVAHPGNCEYKKRMTEALGKTKRKWQMTYTSPDISGIQYAIESGLGISVITNATITPSMRILNPGDGVPEVENIKIGLFYKLPKTSEPGHELASQLLESIEQTTNQSFRQGKIE